MAVDDVIKAARNMARTTGQVLDNSKTATKALNKIVNEHGTALNNAKKIASSKTATKARQEYVFSYHCLLNKFTRKQTLSGEYFFKTISRERSLCPTRRSRTSPASSLLS